MLNFTQRNLKVFFRQKSAVFFSLLGVILVIGLYVLFLGDVWIRNFPEIQGAKGLMGTWVIAGIVSITPVTTAMGAFEAMVQDRSRKLNRDFLASPVQRWKLVGGYVFSAYLVALLMSLVALALGELYILSCGGKVLASGALGKTLLILPLSTLASSAMVFFFVSFFQSPAAFSTASTVIGTLIGFLTGIYLPLGSLPEAVRWVVKLFPVSHAGALLRQVMLEAPTAECFAGAPEAAVRDFQESMGVLYRYGDFTAGPFTHVLVLLGVSILFFLPAWWNVSRKKS
ncbi:ABC transporter permease [Neglectibacter timonensis]|uniref:ABC transporter permease n=1 Tax=Neglectibacter timonensis TaxID=1776382 RepID=A0ABT1RUX8_9FIRM|nr:ABC transporter permease [Neglectibacter timonensis]MCQ4838478.1 ABC transporter permease [Neglectibacter timonensis]MCQ4844240.1 ABC transporter permease [Neglectibacter timonensis]